MKFNLVQVVFLIIMGGSTAFVSEGQLLPRLTNVYRVEKNDTTSADEFIYPAMESDTARLTEKKKSAFSRIGDASGSAWQWMKRNHVADNLEAAFTIGTGGLSLELATPVTRWTRVRAGVEWFPSVNLPMSFEIASLNDDVVSDDVSHIQQMVYDLTGLEMSNEVKMTAKPHVLNFKFLVDVFPFQNNRHWHFTAGFYVGAPTIGKVRNNRNQMTTLVALNIYNRAYDYFMHVTDIYDVPIGGGNYLDPDEVLELQDKFREYGRIGIHLGDFKNGKPYLMEPSSDGQVRAKARTNSFKPYLGFGYSGAIDKAQRWNVGFEAGAIFWGGAPDVILHDGVNMTKDLKNVGGKVGDYLNFMKAIPVYPVVNFKISYSFF